MWIPALIIVCLVKVPVRFDGKWMHRTEFRNAIFVFAGLGLRRAGKAEKGGEERFQSVVTAGSEHLTPQS